MKNNDNLRGLKSVYSFTLSQNMKSKSNIVSMLILFVMVLISLPLQNLTGNSVSISPIQTAYVTNESGTELDFDALTAQNAAFSSVSFETAEFDKTSYADHLGDTDVIWEEIAVRSDSISSALRELFSAIWLSTVQAPLLSGALI